MTSVQPKTQNFKWVSCQSAQDNPNKYEILTLDLTKMIDSWAMSIVAHEWLTNGSFRPVSDLKKHLQEEWGVALSKIEETQTIERPILGLGILDNIEVGTNRAILSIADHLNLNTIEVLVPKNMTSMFDTFQS